MEGHDEERRDEVTRIGREREDREERGRGRATPAIVQLGSHAKPMIIAIVIHDGNARGGGGGGGGGLIRKTRLRKRRRGFGGGLARGGSAAQLRAVQRGRGQLG